MPLSQIDDRNAILVVGSNLRSEAPLLAHRVRKAAVSGASVTFANPRRFEYLFPVAEYLVPDSGSLSESLASLVAAAAEITAKPVPETARAFLPTGKLSDQPLATARSLLSAEKGVILLGLIAQRDPIYADIRSLAAALAELTGCALGYLSEGGNSAGASLAGVLPHRGRNGEPREAVGLNAAEMIEQPRKAYLLVGIEPEGDFLDRDAATKALVQADTVVGLVSFVSQDLLECCDVLLPVATFAETSGTFVNVEGRWQSFAGAARPQGETRPAWKVLRVLGNLLGLQGFEYETSEQVRDSLAHVEGAGGVAAGYRGSHIASIDTGAAGYTDVPMYAVDALVRRSHALQQTRAAGQEESAPIQNAAAG
jgi:NADH-quinone oxidoreductase subunit G